MEKLTCLLPLNLLEYLFLFEDLCAVEIELMVNVSICPMNCLKQVDFWFCSVQVFGLYNVLEFSCNFSCIRMMLMIYFHFTLQERLILKQLKFRLNVPTPYVFMLRFLKAAQSDTKVCSSLQYMLLL